MQNEPTETQDPPNVTTEGPSSKPLHCSFCGKMADELETLIVADGDIAICNKCVDVCNTIIARRRER